MVRKGALQKKPAMKKELNYFRIENALGWNQDWFQDWTMRIGGCAAVTACDFCIYLARQKNLASLYPYDAHHLRKKDYLAFSAVMKPYLRPRAHGINTLEIYISGLSAYWQDRGTGFLKMEGLSGTASWQEAKTTIKEQIECEMLVPFLLLHHKNRLFDDFQWHWFNLAGYEESGGKFHVKAITYGSFFWMDLEELWDTGYPEKGGIISVLV